MLEAPVERRLEKLESYGFKQLKMKTPGTNGTKDRLILMPKWSPAPPVMVEIKRPGKSERELQLAVRDDWRARGCDVRDMCDTYDKIDALVDDLLIEAVRRYVDMYDKITDLPYHIRDAYAAANSRRIWKV